MAVRPVNIVDNYTRLGV